MLFRKLRSRLSSRRHQDNDGSIQATPETANDTLINILPPTPNAPSSTPVQQLEGTGKRDLWAEALEALDKSSQEKLEKKGMSKMNSEPMENQLKALQREAETQCERCKGREWRIPLGSHQIPVRETTLQIIKWVKKIGDVAVEFAPSPGHGVWALARSVLQEVNEFDKEKVAVLSVVENVARVLFSAQIYCEIYTVERTGKQEAVGQLQDEVIKLYSCILRVMLKSSDLSSNTAVQFCQAVFGSEKSFDLFLEMQEQEQGLTKAAGICEITARARTDASLQGYLREAQDSLYQITENVEHIFKWVDDQERRDLLQWVSKVPYGRHFDDIERRRSPNTGDWLIHHEKFVEWHDSPLSSLIWLQGSPGTGKTFLSSATIKYLNGTDGKPFEGLAYFFCNRDEDTRRRALPVLQSLVRQLATPKHRTEKVRKGLQQACEEAMGNGSDLGLDECQVQLVESFNNFSRTIIVLDALDEIIDEELLILVKTLDIAISKTRKVVKLFIASRPETRIESRYGSKPTVKIQNRDNMKDIENHVDTKLAEYKEDYPNSDVSMMAVQIRDTILRKCDNMFLWADLQMKQIFRCRTSDSVIEMLTNLPRGLENTYKQIHQKIRDHASVEQGIAERALKWVMSSPRLLTSDELLAAVRMIIEEEDVKLKAPLRPETLLSICENLLVVDSNDEWRFFHLSAREYFEQIEGEKDLARSHCAQICLSYLMQIFDPGNPFEPVELQSSSSLLRETTDEIQIPNDPFDIHHPFFNHAQRFWPFYVRDQPQNDQSIFFLKRFLGSPSESSIFFCRWHTQIFESPLPIRFEFGPASPYILLGAKDLEPIATPMFAITLLPLFKSLQEWCKAACFDASQKNRRNRSLLSISAAAGNVDLCEILVSKGACVNEIIYGQDGSALAAACRNGNLDTAKYLVEVGANVNLSLEVGRYGSALATAIVAPTGGLNVVKYLVKAGADVNMTLEAGKYGSALATAAQRGYLDIVKFLVHSGADVNMLLPEHSYGSALAAATTAPKQAMEMVKYLIEAGADVNLPLQGGYHGSALATAANGPTGNIEVIKSLIEAGADVNQTLDIGGSGSALAAAASRPTETLEITRHLVTSGADVNLVLSGGDFGSALIAAVCKGDIDTIKYLIKAGADVNFLPRVGWYGSALAAAAGQRNLEVTKYLVEAGADVNALLQVGDYGSALARAAGCPFGNSSALRGPAMIEYLVDEAEADVDLELRTGKYPSALAAAEAESKLIVIESLRQRQVTVS